VEEGGEEVDPGVEGFEDYRAVEGQIAGGSRFKHVDSYHDTRALHKHRGAREKNDTLARYPRAVKP